MPFTYWNSSDRFAPSRSGSTRAIRTVQWKKNVNTGVWTSQILNENRYTYDYGTGQRLTNEVTDQYGSVRTETYGYDELSRLKTVNYGDGGTQSYAFDSMGNRLSKTNNGWTETYSYNAANM
jgi:YD repeat-containing protein